MEFVTITIAGRHLRLHEEGNEAGLRADGRCVDVDTTFERVELGHDRIALRTIDGRFLAVRSDRDRHVLALEADLTPAAALEEVLWPSGQVSLRSCELTYLGVQMASPSVVTVDRTEPTLTERFVLVPVAAAMVPRQRVAPRPAPDRPAPARS